MIVDSFDSPEHADLLSAPLGSYPHEKIAHGTAWVAFLADPGRGVSGTRLQEQITNDAAGLVGGGSASLPSTSAQTTVLGAVAAGLGGTVSDLP